MISRSQAEALGPNELTRYDCASEVVERLRKEWRLGALTPLEGAYCSFLYATEEGTVLKYSLDPEEATSGVRCLLAFSGHGGVPVLGHDRETGAILMRRAIPGTTLDQEIEDDEEATRLTAGVVGQLRQAPFADCTPLSDWYRVLRQSYGAIDHRFIGSAIEISDWLFDTSPEPTLLHGDFHHYNLLRNGDEWWVIDPKGVIGDPVFEAAAYLRNNLENVSTVTDLSRILRRRIEIFSEELGDDPRRIWGWGFAQNVVSYVWDGWDSKGDFLKILDALWQIGITDSYWR